MDFDERLAALLQNYPAIWNRRSNDFKNNLKKENSYKEIALELRCTVETVQQRYRCIREKYRKEKLKMKEQTRSGAGQQISEPWYLLETLRFLDDVIIKRKKVTSNIPIETLQSTSIDETSSYTEKLPNCPFSIIMIDEPEPSSSITETLNVTVSNDNENLIQSPSLEKSTPSISPSVITPSVGSRNATCTRNIKKRKRNSESPTLKECISELRHAAATIATMPEPVTNRWDGIGTYISETLSTLEENVAVECVNELINIVTQYKLR